MSNKTLRASVIVLIALLSSGTVDARQAKSPARPRPGAPTVELPRYTSLEAFRASRKGTSSLATIAAGVGMGRQSVPARLSTSGATSLSVHKSALAVSSGPVSILRAANGTVSWMRGNLGNLAVAGKNAGTAQLADAAVRSLDRWRGALMLRDPANELEGVSSSVDRLGMTHVRFRQVLDGIPVWAREVIVHTDPQGTIVALNGTYEPTPTRRRDRQHVTGREALQRVERELRSEGRWNPPTTRTLARFGIDGPSVSPVYYPDAAGSVVRAWEVSLHPNLVQWYTFIVDAGTGEVLNRFSRHCTIVHDPDLGSQIDPFEDTSDNTGIPENLSFSPRAGSFIDATATDLMGQTRSMRVYREDSGTHYAVWDLPNLGAISLPNMPDIGGAITLTAGNTDDFDKAQHITSTNNVWNDPASVSAHLNAKIAYDYFATTFSRRAINDKDESMISIVHITEKGKSMENAFWTGRIMGYGDGGTLFKPLAGGLDVAAHEMTHGVIDHTANLVYQNQSGALNESMADVFGSFVDRGDFLMGEDIIKPGFGAALRDMENPGSAQLDADFRQPAHMSEFRNLAPNQDNGGVHVNSGIPNRAAVMIIKSLGYEKAEQIYYRALSTYLTRTSQFGDARKALEQSATDLYGSGAELAAVSQAFDTVGITVDTQGTGGSEGNEVQPTTGPAYVAFVVEDNTIGLLEIASGNAYILGDAAEVVTSGGTQLSTPANGAAIWYINADGFLARFDLNTLSNAVLSGLYVQDPGDLWNVAITPDEYYAVLASAYDDDPNLYVTDGTEWAIIELQAQTTQEGVLDHSILYPDVISISPNNDQPRISFDALREVQVGADALRFWSIFEIDVDTYRIYNLLPAQPVGYSVGNITYSNTDPDIVAFNTIDEANNLYETWVANLASGEVFSVDTGGLTDAERPSFAPDDSGLVFSSPSTQQLVFFDGATGELSSASFGVGLSRPKWFAVGTPGGTAIEKNELPTAFRIESVYPNPFASGATVNVHVDQAGPLRVSVYDVLGRELERIQDGMLAPGEHAFTWQATNRPSGAYIMKATAGGMTVSRSVILAR